MTNPNLAHARLRSLIRLRDERPLTAAEVAEFLDTTDDLDDYLSEGGLLPDAWAGAAQPLDYDYEPRPAEEDVPVNATAGGEPVL